ncbi:MAG: hypothetical protein SPL48_02315, partial [Bacteroidales bacterium]|nr:hypothetical protein [Bacteroidales bacterium]
DNECGQSDSDRIHKLEDFKKKIIAQAFVHSPCDSAKLRKIADTAMQVQQRHLIWQAIVNPCFFYEI